MRKILELSGNVYGYVEVLEFSGINDKHASTWKCKCNKCGKEFIAIGTDLKRGCYQSCGCARNELISKSKSLPFGDACFNMLYHDYERGASKRNIYFNLSKDEFRILTKQKCNYCGTVPTTKIEANNKYYIYNGVDRIDNSKGYTKENCVSCCKRCNLAKREMSYEEFKEWVSCVYKNICSR